MLPHVVLVADKFHPVAVGNPMLTEDRQRATLTRGTAWAREGPGVGLAPQAATARVRTRLTARAVHPAVEPLIDTDEPRHRGAARVYLRYDNFDSGGLRPRLNVDREEPKSSTTPRAIHWYASRGK